MPLHVVLVPGFDCNPSLLSTSIRPIPSFTIMTWLNQRRVFVPSARNLVLFQGGPYVKLIQASWFSPYSRLGKIIASQAPWKRGKYVMVSQYYVILLQLHHSHQTYSGWWFQILKGCRPCRRPLTEETARCVEANLCRIEMNNGTTCGIRFGRSQHATSRLFLFPSENMHRFVFSEEFHEVSMLVLKTAETFL